MTQKTELVSPGLQFILATRHLERIADHATNIAEDIIFWVRGLDVRHGRGRAVRSECAEETDTVTTSGVTDPGATDSGVTENSHGLDADVNTAWDTEHV